MIYSNLTYKSDNSLKRLTHSSRHRKCVKIINKLKFETLLDFGSGDGQLFNFLDLKTKKKYYAYEPNKLMYLQFKKNNHNFKSVNLITNKKNLNKNFYDVVCVNEVFEHLPNKEIFEIIKTLKLIIKKKSTIIISVPIEVGFASLLKNFIRYFSNSQHDNMTISNLIRSFFFMRINRGKKKYYNSHIGFNHNHLKKILETNFLIQEIAYTPFDIFKGFLNSQVFYTCKNEI